MSQNLVIAKRKLITINVPVFDCILSSHNNLKVFLVSNFKLLVLSNKIHMVIGLRVAGYVIWTLLSIYLGKSFNEDILLAMKEHFFALICLQIYPWLQFFGVVVKTQSLRSSRRFSYLSCRLWSDWRALVYVFWKGLGFRLVNISHCIKYFCRHRS